MPSASSSDGGWQAWSGVVAAGHPGTARAGADVLRAGGNAVDAAVAAVLTSAVVEPMMTGLAGGGYLMVAPPGGEPTLLDFFVDRARPRRRPGRPRPAARRRRCPSATRVQVFGAGAAVLRRCTGCRPASPRRWTGSARCRWPR